jgi:hypothetical protein
MVLKGQQFDIAETKPCSSKEHKRPKHIRAPLHICKLPLNKCQLLAQTSQAGSQNQSDRLPKLVRPVAKTDQTALVQQTTPPKSQKCKKCTSSPLTPGIGSRDAMQFFSTFLSPPRCQCMNQGSNLKICNLELLKYTKFITRGYTCPNEQVRYSKAL